MSKHEYHPQWNASHHSATHWTSLSGGDVQCDLTPRHCKIKEGRAGFCGTRKNVNGKLITLNYGRATHLTQESIETEAVFHYAPGAPILSVGNIGCMMNCDYCQNWKTSQARLLNPEDVYTYTPEQIVDICLERNIPIISWTYNDPVVWQEFVMDTSKIAQENGIKVLYKSAFYITKEAAAELCKYVDIFSVSLKSLDPAFYKRLTKGELEPVLEATKYVFDQGKHVEISNLMVTDANDTVESAVNLARWVCEELSPEVPLHFVRFHPDYKYTHVGRTPIERLIKARQACLDAGIKHCYVGNAYDVDAVHSYCTNCGSRLIERYGLHAEPVGLDKNGCCTSCGEKFNYVPLDYKSGYGEQQDDLANEITRGGGQERQFTWEGDINAIHVEIESNGEGAGLLRCSPVMADGAIGPGKTHQVSANAPFRFAVSKSSPDEVGVKIQATGNLNVTIYEVFDRAHFPTVSTDAAARTNDATPFPLYTGHKSHATCPDGSQGS